MKKLFMFILTVVFILSLGLVQNADATLLELEGFVDPTNAIIADQGDGTSLFSQIDYIFNITKADDGAMLNALQLEFHTDVFASIGTAVAVYPTDWSYFVNDTTYQVGLAGTRLGLGEQLRFTVYDILVRNEALLDPTLWQEGQIWSQSWAAIDTTKGYRAMDGGSTSALVPEPGTLMLFGSGLAGLLYVRRSKTFKI